MKEIRRRKRESAFIREQWRRHYENKYFALWMSKFEWKGIDEEQERFVMSQFWNQGKIACFKLKGSEGSESHPQGLLVFTSFAPTMYNIYNQPTHVTLINTRGVKFIPSSPQEVNKDVVLGYSSKQRNPILSLISPLIDKIVDVEMVIRINLDVHKVPWIVPVSDFDKEAVDKIANAIDNDETRIFIDVNEPNKATALVSGAPYIIDKLYQYKTALENEIRELLGFNNIGVMEKKEHLINGEIEANNDVLDQSDLSYLLSMEEFAKSVREILGVTDFKVRLRESGSDDEQDPKDDREVEDDSDE